jgi:HK97 family phage major capsid protein
MTPKQWWFLNCRPTVAPQQNPVFNILIPIGLVIVAMFAVLAVGFAATHQGNAHVQIAEITAPSLVVIKDAIENQAKAFDAFKDTNDKKIEAIKSGNESLAKELDQKLGRIEVDLKKQNEVRINWEAEMKFFTERLEELESRAKTPGKTGEEKARDEYHDAFVTWIRHKAAYAEDERRLSDAEKKLGRETKDITVGSNAGGGYALPKVIAQQIEQFELKYSPVRRLVKVVQAGTTDFHQLLNLRGATSGWVGETSNRNASNTPQLRDIVPTFGELYAYPQISEWSTDDLQFDVETWLAENVADEYARQEGIAVLTGNGSNKPTGMLNTTPLSTADNASPVRTAAAYQYIDSVASPFSVNGSDALIKIIYTLNSAYRAGSTWIMNSNTIASVRGLKDSQNRYLWEPSLQAGQPNTLLGYTQETWEDLDDIGSGKFPVAFGNFQRAYLLADRVGMRITRDNVTNPGYIRFYVRRREGGIVLNNDSLKWIKTS